MEGGRCKWIDTRSATGPLIHADVCVCVCERERESVCVCARTLVCIATFAAGL